MNLVAYCVGRRVIGANRTFCDSCENALISRLWVQCCWVRQWTGDILLVVAEQKHETIHQNLPCAVIHQDNNFSRFAVVELQPQLLHSGPLTSSTVPIGLLGPAPVPLEDPPPADPDALGVFEDGHLGRVWYEFGRLRVLNWEFWAAAYGSSYMKPCQ